MPHLTKAQLMRAFNRGDNETVKRECLRYGVIVKDAEWMTETGRYAGASRYRVVHYFGLVWRIEQLNGEVICLSHSNG